MRHAVFASLLVLVSSLLIVPLGWATWGVTFRNLGTATVVGEPECADFGAQKVVCVAQGADHALMANEFNKTTWSGWTSISTVVSSNASCVNDANNRIVCGVRAADNTLVATVFDGTTWSGFADSSRQIFSNPSCALLRKAAVLCTARSVSGGLTASVF